MNVLLLRAWLYDDIALEMLLINAQLGNMFLKQSLHLESGKSFRNNVSKFRQALIMSLLNISLPTRASHYVMSFSFPSLDELVIIKLLSSTFLSLRNRRKRGRGRGAGEKWGSAS